MRDEITEIYYSKEPICEDGRDFLCNRFLSTVEAHRCGICSRNGMIYFLYFQNGECVRWKARSMSDKKQQFMSKLQNEDASGFKMPFFSHSKAPPSDYLLITEGEFDCVALTQLVPNGEVFL